MTQTPMNRLGKIMAGCALGLALSATAFAADKTADAPAAARVALAPSSRAMIPETADISDRTGIAATVNDDAITYSDIRNRLDLYLAGNPQKPPPEVRHKLEMQVLDKLIDEKLQMQEAKKQGITVTDDDVKDGFNQIAKQNNMSVEEFRHKLDVTGVKMSTLTDQIRAEMAWTQVVRRKLRPDVNVSESEIDTALVQITRAKGSTEYLAADIFLPVPGPEMETSVRHDADDLIESIKHGGNFAAAARKFSKAPGATAGGDMGWVREGTVDPKLAAALKTMHPGEISEPIRTDKGFEILFLRDVHEPGAATSAAGAAPPAPAPATPQAAASAPSKPETIVHLKQITIPIDASDPAPVVAAKMNRATTLKGEISSCDQMDKKSKDFVSPGTTDMGSGPVSSLPEPVRRAIENLPVGTLSGPVRGDNGVAVLMVCERHEIPGREEPAAAPAPAPAPVPKAAVASAGGNEDGARDQIANQIGMKRLDQMQEHYLRDLRATAFIDKRI